MTLNNPRFSSDRDIVAASKNSPPMKNGAKGEGVAILQQALLDLAFQMPKSTRARGGLPDGLYGEETEKAVRAFQRSSGLREDGIAGRETLQRLEAAINALSHYEETRFQAEFLRLSAQGGQVG